MTSSDDELRAATAAQLAVERDMRQRVRLSARLLRAAREALESGDTRDVIADLRVVEAGLRGAL